VRFATRLADGFHENHAGGIRAHAAVQSSLACHAGAQKLETTHIGPSVDKARHGFKRTANYLPLLVREIDGNWCIPSIIRHPILLATLNIRMQLYLGSGAV